MREYTVNTLEKPYDEEVLEFAKEAEATLNAFTCRFYAEESRGEESRDAAGPGNRHRNVLWRDYARILYSSSFRRLQGKMQLLGVDQTKFFRNRLTHSFEVAQIARGIAAKLELKDPVAAEACSLAHDLGNPPFGHAGERLLSEKVGKDLDGYEGNAQTLRTLMRLEKKIPEHGGLNLSLRTLLGIVKYDYRGIEGSESALGKGHPKYIYTEDYDKLHNKLREVGGRFADDSPLRTIDVQIMDLADEIAYAAHDLEDCLAAGHFTIGELIHEFRISGQGAPGDEEDFSSATEKLEEEVARCRKFAKKATRLKSSEEYAFLFRKELTSALVNRLIQDLGVVSTGDAGRQQLGYKDDSKLAPGLKKLVFKATLRRPDVHLYEKQGAKVIEGLFEVYTDPKYNDKLRLLPPEYRELKNDSGVGYNLHRLVADYIGGMQDSFALQEFERHFGRSSLDGPFRSDQ